ncbi:MAG: hypothetical protein IT350_07635, partial [Deltaproteobacteria bacterium]|nr:hypothetical protein [Deltaproteobacteria bacterium]
MSRKSQFTPNKPKFGGQAQRDAMVRRSETLYEIQSSRAGSAAIAVNVWAQPKPATQYSADRAFCRASDAGLNLVFVQLDPITDTPITAVKVC